MDDEFYYTVDELSTLFKVTNATIRDWIRKNYFPNAFRLGGGEKASWRVPKADVKAFAQKEYGP